MKKVGKVLVVDDNAGIRSALKILLPLRFEAVEILPSPSQLISTVNSFQPDVILLDMNFNTDINTGNEGLFWLSVRLHREALGEREASRYAGKGGGGEPQGQQEV